MVRRLCLLRDLDPAVTGLLSGDGSYEWRHWPQHRRVLEQPTHVAIQSRGDMRNTVGHCGRLLKLSRSPPLLFEAAPIDIVPVPNAEVERCTKP